MYPETGDIFFGIYRNASVCKGGSVCFGEGPQRTEPPVFKAVYIPTKFRPIQ